MQRTTDNKPQAKLIHHFLEQSTKLFPDKTALVHEEVRATYSQINTKANLLAHWLIKLGISKGDRIVLFLENCLEYVVSYYGVLKTGAVAVPLSSDLKPDGLKPLLEELEPEVIIATSRFERLLKATDLSLYSIRALLLKNPKQKWSSYPFAVFPWEDVIRDDVTVNLPIRFKTSIEESDLASIIYTSGSTGTPKGVMLSHNNIVSNTNSICRYLALTDKDIQMAVLPFFYVMGKSLLNTHFAVGGSVVINNKFAFPAAVIKQMVEEKVTGFSGVPSTYAYLLHRSPLKSYRNRLHSLRYCTQAGGHMSQQIKKELRKVLPVHTQIYIMYGATEASARLTYLRPDQLANRMGSIGKPISGVTLKVINKSGKELPAGQTGELVASGKNIMQGYWKDKKATSAALDENGYHTGDLGYYDEKGYFFVNGRKDNLLKVGGHRINPQEIEDALMATELVIETAVIGVPDELLGNKIVAIAVPKNGTSSNNKIMKLCADKLPKYKLPSSIKLVRLLPKNTNGKIDRTKCLEIAR
ncbi:MAG: class I adenylate-forming enzyme family protein [Thermodesulfobacteriota bacterium]|nr:class I adenylate-forming enzyme family protein [Thermodesulfobacteriota bacterium]